ncbi:3387_t:CDS:2 [Racocetra persica]|uniref:3387_t:CDS:1 n=1 Tax=Racocetra persica TaxID=160502 RepID=A0ACA9KY99_9GLOM|nr:3387_t:CDS:2 [Racocetra persica]
MAKGSNGNRESEDRNEEGRNGRGGREGNGIGYTKNIRRDGGGRDQRSRGEGSNGRRRERKPKDSSSGSLTTPTPDHLSKSFYQAPVILERRPQTSSVSTPQVPDKGEEEGSSQTTFHPPVRIFRDDSFNRASSVNAPRVETKPMTFKGKPFDKPFVKMINEKGVLNHESVLKILSDLPGHFVVGVCGPQGVGKSTVISALCQDPQNAFPMQSIDTLNLACHETTGIDVHITPERIILLDTQPVFSLSVLEHAMRNDYIPDNISPELWLELQSLQIVIFLFSVCNVVITVTESIDYAMWNFLKKAEMLKYHIPEFPTIPSLASMDAGTEYYPDIVLVCNKTLPADFTSTKHTSICDLLNNMFKDSNLKVFGNVSMTKSLTMYKYPDNERLPNVFLLPYENQPLRPKGEYIGFTYLNAPDTFIVLAESLRNQIFQLPKKAGKKGQVSEKEWFRSSMRIWDTVRKSEFITEYGKLATKLREM